MTTRPHENLDLIRRVLGKDYLEMSIAKLTATEDFEDGVSRVTVETVDTNGNTLTVEGSGAGVIDALWSGFLDRFALEYQSLRSIELQSFVLNARLDTKLKSSSGTDALGEVKVQIRNSEGTLFGFADESRSILRSSTRAVLAAIEYFVNAERAFIVLHNSLKDARERQRTDLVTRYTKELAEVVKSTSYAEIIENVKKDL